MLWRISTEVIASTAKNCVEFALDYPVDGLNFTCSSDTSKTYITMIEPKSNAATGKCSEGDKVHFFIQEKTDQYIDLGTVSLSDIGMVSTAGAGYPRLSVLDMARGLTGRQATSLSSSDETIQVATRWFACYKHFLLRVEERLQVIFDLNNYAL